MTTWQFLMVCVAVLPSSTRSHEDVIAEARSDLIAWVWGGAVWSAVVVLLYGDAPHAAIGAACAFCLRRILRPFIVF